MSIMDIFKSVVSPAAQPQNPQQTVQNTPANNNPAIPNENTPKSDGSLAAIPKAAEGDKSPLANFADLWKTDPNAKKTPAEPAITIDPKKIAEAAKSMDFSAAISQEARDKAAKGDTTQLVTEVTQASLAVAMQSSATLVNQALEQQAAKFQTEIIPNLLKKNNLSQAVREKNPIFDNPAIKPFQSALEGALAVKNPGKSPDEIASMANQFMTEMSEAVLTASGKSIVDTKDGGKNPGSVAAKEQDWGKFFGVSE